MIKFLKTLGFVGVGALIYLIPLSILSGLVYLIWNFAAYVFGTIGVYFAIGLLASAVSHLHELGKDLCRSWKENHERARAQSNPPVELETLEFEDVENKRLP